MKKAPSVPETVYPLVIILCALFLGACVYGTVVGVRAAIAKYSTPHPVDTFFESSDTQVAIRASKEIGLHEVMIVGCEPTNITDGGSPKANVHAYNKAFHFEMFSHMDCGAFSVGMVARIDGDRVVIADRPNIWVSTPR